MHSRQDKIEAFGRLLDVLDTLREKCPWDAKQTNLSLRPNTIEEVHELSEALLAGDTKDIMKELGDVLLHIAFYAKIGEEQQLYDIKMVCDALTDKLIFRHPHIYGNVKAETATEVEQNWEQIKLKEKGGNKSVMSGVPKSLPALIKAHRVQEKACNYGFDWSDRRDVWGKVQEEIQELQQELEIGSTPDRVESELGDLLFSLINMARLYNLDADRALERTNAKFIRRFTYIEEKARTLGRPLKELSLEEMEAYWQEAKSTEMQG